MSNNAYPCKLNIEDSDENFNIASARLVEMLKHPDDLDTKIVTMKKKIQDELSASQRQLLNDVQTYKDDSSNVIEVFQSTQKLITEVLDKLDNIKSTYNQTTSSIPQYEIIKQLSQTKENMDSAQDYFISFKEFKKRLQWIKSKLDKAISDNNPKNLLAIHYELFHIEKFKERTLLEAKGGSREVLVSVNQMFMSLKETLDIFNTYFWNLVASIFDLFENNNLPTIVHVMKIIECEETADKQINQNQNHFNTKKFENSKNLINREPKNYKQIFIDTFKTAIETKFRQVINYSIELNEDYYVMVDNLLEIPNLVSKYIEELVNCFPKSYAIGPLIIDEFNRLCSATISTMIQNKGIENLEGSEILHTLDFIQEYNVNMKKIAKKTNASIDRKQLDDYQKRLIESYILLVKDKMQEWINNILKTQLEEFINRNSALKTDLEGRYCFSVTVLIFQMFDEQIDLASDSNSAKLLVDVTKECRNSSIFYQSRIKAAIEKECKAYLADKQNAISGLPEYIIGIINDQVMCVEMGDGLIAKISTLLHESFRNKAISYLNEQTNGFVQISDYGTGAIVDIIYFDVHHIFNKLYTQVWYEEEMLNTIIATLTDYCSDYEKTIIPSVFEKFVIKLLDEFVYKQINQLKNKNVKFTPSVFGIKINTELSLTKKFFATYLNDKSINEAFDPFEKLIKLLTSPSNLIFLEYFPIKKQYLDLPLKLVESILYKRDDLDRAQVKELVNLMKSKDEEYYADTQQTQTKSVFTRISLLGSQFNFFLIQK